MLMVLVNNIQHAVVMYVVDKEREFYQGNYRYEMNYFRKSDALSQARIADLERLDLLLQQAVRENQTPLDLVTHLRYFIESLTTGFRFIFRFSSGHSTLKTALITALCLSEPSIKPWFAIAPDLGVTPHFSEAVSSDIRTPGMDTITLADHLALERRYETLKRECDETRQTVLRMQTIINRLVKAQHGIPVSVSDTSSQDDDGEQSSITFFQAPR